MTKCDGKMCDGCCHSDSHALKSMKDEQRSNTNESGFRRIGE